MIFVVSVYSDLVIKVAKHTHGSLLSTGVVWAHHPILKGVIMPGVIAMATGDHECLQ